MGVGWPFPSEEERMYARVSDVHAGDTEKGIEDYRTQVVPALRGMPGFVRTYLLVDRENTEALSISVWETEEAMRASEEAAAKIRASVGQDMGAADITVSRFEVVVAEGAE
jgi:heme-degrading monooxygenase HmoA